MTRLDAAALDRLSARLTAQEIAALLDVCDRLARGHAPLWLLAFVVRIVRGK